MRNIIIILSEAGDALNCCHIFISNRFSLIINLMVFVCRLDVNFTIVFE